MLFSEEKKFVLVAVPKTGSTALQRCLVDSDLGVRKNFVRNDAGDWVKIPTHASVCEIRAAIGSRADDYKFIAFLRNPRDIVISKYYFYRAGRAARLHGLFQEMDDSKSQRNWGKTARVLVAKLLPASVWFRLYPYRSSTHFIADASGNLLINEIGVFEHLQEEVLRIFIPLGYTPENLALQVRNKTAYEPRAEEVELLDRILVKRLASDVRFYQEALGRTLGQTVS